jgi:hypothetical protein
MQSETKLDNSLKIMVPLQVDTNKHEDLNLMFENHGKEQEIYPLTTNRNSKAQKKDHQIYSKQMQKHQKLICIFTLLKTQ